MFFLSVPEGFNTNTTAEVQRMMDTYGDAVLRTSYMYLKDLQKAEDAFQEVFIKVFQKHSQFKGDSSEKTWIIKITMNVCRDMLKSTWFKKVLITDRFKNRSVDVEERVIRSDENKQLFEAVMSLPPVFKEVILLYYYQECDTTEIAKILGIAEGTVRSRLHRAREMLKNKLGGRRMIE